MAQSLSGASKVPEIAWAYWGLVGFMETYPASYGLCEMRSKQHVELCEHYGLTRKQTLTVTDNLHKYTDACKMHDALMSIQSEATP